MIYRRTRNEAGRDQHRCCEPVHAEGFGASPVGAHDDRVSDRGECCKGQRPAECFGAGACHTASTTAPEVMSRTPLIEVSPRMLSGATPKSIVDCRGDTMNRAPGPMMATAAMIAMTSARRHDAPLVRRTRRDPARALLGLRRQTGPHRRGGAQRFRRHRSRARGRRCIAAATRMRAHLDFAAAHPPVYEAMFSLPSGLRFAAADTPEPLHRAFSAIRDAFPDADDVRAEVAWSARHGLVTSRPVDACPSVSRKPEPISPTACSLAAGRLTRPARSRGESVNHRAALPDLDHCRISARCGGLD